MFVLTLLRKHGPLTLPDLSDRARVTPGSMSQTVNRLTADGHVTRSRDPHDRRRGDSPTPPGGTGRTGSVRGLTRSPRPSAARSPRPAGSSATLPIPEPSLSRR
jgi:predicted ArsR family transcriptional regulator